MRFLPLATAFILYAGFASAQWYEGEGEDRTLASSEPSQGSDGDMGAMVFMTNDPEGFFKQWNKPPSPDYKPSIATVSEAQRGDVVMAVVLFSGCKPDQNGKCNSQVDFRVINPDGSIYSDLSGGELWVNKPAIPKGSLQLSVDNLGFKVELDDQLGEYRIEVAVRDLVSSSELNLLQTIVVTGTEGNGT
jgi:hypothetical protein